MPQYGHLTSLMQHMSMLYCCSVWTSCSGFNSPFKVRTFHVAIRRLYRGSGLYLELAGAAFKGIRGLSRKAASPALKAISCYQVGDADSGFVWLNLHIINEEMVATSPVPFLVLCFGGCGALPN